MPSNRNFSKCLARRRLEMETYERRELMASDFQIVDINQKSIAQNFNSFFELNGQAVIGLQTPIGVATFTSDGTESGTLPAPGLPVANVTRIGNDYYYFGDGSTYVLTSTGITVQLVAGCAGQEFTQLGTQVIFLACGELWKSNGTPQGTVMVKDIRPGSANSNPSGLVAVENAIFFTADDGLSGRELWKTDGTNEGTVLVRDLSPGTGSANPRQLTAFQGKLFFTALSSGYSELFVSDGTSDGTGVFKDLTPIGGSSNPLILGKSSSRLFFSAVGAIQNGSSTSFTGTELWSTDGSVDGTALVSDINPGGNSSNPRSLVQIGNYFIFSASSLGSPGNQDVELWRTDGTDAGTVRIKDINLGNGSSSPSSITSVGDFAYFFANDGTSGNELWRTDGTTVGTYLVKQIVPGSSGLTSFLSSPIDNKLFFLAGTPQERNWWASDGTEQGTVRISNINASSTAQGSSLFGGNSGDALAVADDGVNGRELWYINGSGGANLTRDVFPGLADSGSRAITRVGAGWFFAASDGVSGHELWRTEGTSLSTKLVKDIFPGPNGSSISNAISVGNRIYFAANDGTHGTELWVSDGSADGTFIVSDIATGTSSTSLTNFTAVGNILYFTANTTAAGQELWRSDGTADGTYMVKDIFPGSSGSSITSMVNVQGTLFFAANDGQVGAELWKSDGTANGTMLVKDVFTGSVSSGVRAIQNLNGQVLFLAGEPVHGTEWWTTDGTANGTAVLRNLAAGSSSLQASIFKVAGPYLYFAGNDQVNGKELWRTDGTSAGTLMLTNAPGTAYTYFNYSENVQGILYFSTNNGVWKTDGTVDGTTQLQTPFVSTNPQIGNLAVAGNKLFVAGNSISKGREPFYVESPAVPTDVGLSISTLAENLPIGTLVGTLQTANASANQSYTYSLVTGAGSDDNSKFSIVSDQLIANVSANYETQRRYKIRVRSTSAQGPALERVLLIDVTNINERPTVLSQQLSTPAGTSKQISLLGSDPENRAISFSITQMPRFGTLQPSGSSFLYIPNSGFAGADEFYFRASDGVWSSTEGRIGIAVTTVIPSVSFNSSFTVVSEAVGTANLRLSLSAAQPTELSIPISQFGGNLKANKDFFAPSSITIPAGSLSVDLPIAIVNDDIDDDDEFMIFDLVASAQGTYALGTFSRITLQVTDNDGPPTIALATTSQFVTEGQTNLKVDVTVSTEAGKAITFPVLTNGNATFNSDFVVSTGNQAVPPQFTIPSGSRTATFYVSILDDTTPETDESFTLSLGAPLNNSAFVGSPSSVTYTIAANDLPVVNFLEPARKVNESQGTVVVTAFLQAPAPSAMTVPFTVSGSLTPGVDYNIDRSSFVFAAGAQTATATITIIDDSLQEVTDEVLSLRLSPSPSSAYAIGRAPTYTLTVADNDYAQVSFSAPTINLWEDAGTVVLTVTNSKPSTTALTVPYLVQLGGPAGYGSATRDQDYAIATNSFFFPPLATSAQVTVTITNDAVNEAPEYFSLKLLPPLGVFSTTNQVTVAIQDDDPLAAFNQTFVAAVESTVSPSFQVSLSAPSNKSISLPFTLTGTAIAGVDYTRPVPQQITIPAGQQTGSVIIPLLQDTDLDGFKTLSIDLLPPTNALLASQNTRAVLTIADDDTAPTLSMSAGADLIDLRVRSSIQENSRTGTVNVSLSSPATRDVTVTIRAEGNASRGLDYVLQGLVNDQLTIPAGATVASFTIRTIEDSDVESEELITLSLDRPSLGTLSSSNYLLVSIQDNDFSFSIPVQPAAPATPTAACIPNASTLSIPSCIQSGTGGGVGSYSPTTGTTPISVDSGPTSPGSLSIPAVVASQGLLNGAVGFMDANFNNLPDFLDLNSNGIQDDGEPDEPVTYTLSDGMTAFAIPPEMDKNLDGVIGTDEAHFVVSGGTDTSTGLLVSGTLSAPMGIYALTPLTTLVDIAVRSGLSVSVATQRLQAALGIDNYDLYQGNSLQESLGGNSLAAKAYLMHVQIYTSALLIANFISGQGTGAFSIDQLVNLTYEEFARYTSSESGTLNLKSAETISTAIDAVASRSGLTIDGQFKSSVTSVIAHGIQVLESYNFDSFANGKAYLEQLVRAKKVLHGEAAAALQSVGQSSSLLNAFVTNYTGQNLADKISGAQPLVIAPAVVVISDAIQVEGNSGQTTLQFVVQITGDHPTGVDVSYTTADFTATELDYTPTTGSLHWDAGDNSPRTINVPVLADANFEADELVKLQLLPSTTVAIRRPTGFGFILNDDALAQSMPSVESGVSQIEYSTDTADSYLSTPDQNLFRGPITNPIQSSFDGRTDQSDRLIVNYSNRTYRNDHIRFTGGAGTGTDEFQVLGGRFSAINFQVGALGNDVTFVTHDSSDGTAHTIGARIESTERISLHPADVENITIEFPFATTGIVIEDADSNSSGYTRIRSLNNQFAPVTITNPSQRLRVIVHNRATSISSAPDSALAGRVDIIGSYDDTAPVSQVQGLPVNATSTTLTVSLSATDPAGPSGSWISGLSEYDVYVAIDNGSFTRFVTLPVSTTSFNYTASGNHHYFFRSIARDQVGNVEAKSGYDAYTYVGDLLKPVTSIVSATYASSGLFTLIANGNDVGGSTLASFDFYVQVDGATATKIGTINASPQAPGATATASMSYQALVDNASHTYRFYSIGRDAVGNVEDAPAGPDQTITASFTGGVSATGIDVQSGASQRSFINRVDLLFNSATGLEALLNNNRISVERFDLQATNVDIGWGIPVPISGRTLTGNKINLSFGSSGLANDGFYRVRVDTNGDGDPLDPGETFEFYRLRGDANSDAIVDALDTAVVDSLFGRVGNNLDGDLDGNGVVNSTDRNYTLRTYRGRKLADHLKQWLDD